MRENTALADEVAAVSWYQSMDLPGGIRTRGEFDLPGALRHVPLPASLEGKRCLDVGTRDGFWAFEMERRGASEVVGIDVDDPLDLDLPWLPSSTLASLTADESGNKSRAFDVARRALDSSVERTTISVYDLTEEAIGTFDFAFLGTMLLHLRDPIGALASIRRVLRGPLLINEVFALTLSALKPRSAAASLQDWDGALWWIPNVTALGRYVRAAGYHIVRGPKCYVLRFDPRRPTSRFKDRGNQTPLEFFVLRLARGVPHAWILAEPHA